MKHLLPVMEIYQQFQQHCKTRITKEMCERYHVKLDRLVKSWFLQVIVSWFHKQFLCSSAASWKEHPCCQDHENKRMHHQMLKGLVKLKEVSSAERGYRTLREELLQSLNLITRREQEFLTEVDLPSNIYDSLLAKLESQGFRNVSEFNEFLGNLLQQLNTWEERKRNGIFYTPRPIIEYMVEETLKNYLISELAKFGLSLKASSLSELIECVEGDHLNTMFTILHSLTILDPSMGAGDFLIAMQQQLAEMHSKILQRTLQENTASMMKITVGWESQQFDLLELNAIDPKSVDLIVKMYYLLNNALCGVDNDSLTVKIARLRVLLDVIGDKINDSSLDHIGMTKSLVGSLKKGNSLMGFVEKPQSSSSLHHRIALGNGFHWYEEFPGVFEKHGGFSIIIGNPPYMKNKYVHGKHVLEKLYPIYVGDCDLYTLFYYRCYFLLKHGGFLTFISKNKWHHGSSYEPFIKGFLQKFKPLYKIVDFGDHDIFKGVGVTCNIMFLHRKPSSQLEWYQLVKPRYLFPIENPKGYQKYSFKNLGELMKGDNIIKTLRTNAVSLKDLKQKGVIDYGKGPSPVPNTCFTFELRVSKGKSTLVNDYLILEWSPNLRRFFFPLVTAGHVNSPERHVNDPPKFLLYLNDFESETEIAHADAKFFEQIKKLKKCIERRKSPKPWFKYDTARNPHLLKASEKILCSKMKSNTFRYYQEPVAFTSGVSAIVLVNPSSHVSSLVELLPFLNGLVQRHYIMHPSSGIKHDKHRFGFDTSDNIGKLLIPTRIPHHEVIYLGKVYHVVFNLKTWLLANNEPSKIFFNLKTRLLEILDLILFLIETCTWELYFHHEKQKSSRTKENWPITRLVTRHLETLNVHEELNRLRDHLQTDATVSSSSLSNLEKVSMTLEMQDALAEVIQNNHELKKMVEIFLKRGWISRHVSGTVERMVFSTSNQDLVS